MLTKEETLKLILQPHYHVILNNATSLTEDEATEIKKTITRVYPYYQGACEYIDSLVGGGPKKITYYAWANAPIADIADWTPLSEGSTIRYKEAEIPQNTFWGIGTISDEYLVPNLTAGTSTDDYKYIIYAKADTTHYGDEPANEVLYGSKTRIDLHLWLFPDDRLTEGTEEYWTAFDEECDTVFTFGAYRNYSVLANDGSMIPYYTILYPAGSTTTYTYHDTNENDPSYSRDFEVEVKPYGTGEAGSQLIYVSEKEYPSTMLYLKTIGGTTIDKAYKCIENQWEPKVYNSEGELSEYQHELFKCENLDHSSDIKYYIFNEQLQRYFFAEPYLDGYKEYTPTDFALFEFRWRFSSDGDEDYFVLNSDNKLEYFSYISYTVEEIIFNEEDPISSDDNSVTPQEELPTEE